MCELIAKGPFEKLDTIDFCKLAWNTELANNVNSLEKLKQYFSLPEEEEHSMLEVLDNHPMNIPRYYLSLINADDAHDPIRKLAIPTAEELVTAGQMGETTGDPYGDDKHNKGNGILHKYPYSALIVATEYCSMYCRHCFRKRLVGLPNDKTVENFQNAANPTL
jgi:lysine 2,3-aminomutase